MWGLHSGNQIIITAFLMMGARGIFSGTLSDCIMEMGVQRPSVTCPQGLAQSKLSGPQEVLSAVSESSRPL